MKAGGDLGHIKHVRILETQDSVGAASTFTGPKPVRLANVLRPINGSRFILDAKIAPKNVCVTLFCRIIWIESIHR